jgi:hypothetical protein
MIILSAQPATVYHTVFKMDFSPYAEHVNGTWEPPPHWSPANPEILKLPLSYYVGIANNTDEHVYDMYREPNGQ